MDLKSPAGRDRDSVRTGAPMDGHGGSPVGEVQNGLDGIPTTCSDVTLKTGQQGQKHVDSEALPLSGEGRGRQRRGLPQARPLQGLNHAHKPILPPVHLTCGPSGFCPQSHRPPC